jgi:hypothetical protein
MLPTATNLEPQIACHTTTKNQNLSAISKRKKQSKNFPRAQTRIQAGYRSDGSRQTAQKK